MADKYTSPNSARRGKNLTRQDLLAAGNLCRDKGQTAEALAFYAQANAYAPMLALDLSRLIFTEIEGRPFSDLAQDIAAHCPPEVRRKYPLSMLRAAWALKAAGRDAAFEAVLAELDEQLEEGGLLRAEWLLLAAYRHYPRLDKMLPLLQKAAPLFGAVRSQVILPEAPWAFGGYYQLTEFHAQAGEAQAEAASFEKFIALYAPLTGGHGAGADALFRAELAHLQGDLISAEILAHKAFFTAESKQQSIVQLGAAMTLANIALLKADTPGWQSAVDLMKRAADATRQNGPLVRAVLDTARGSLLVELKAQTHIADWLKNRDIPVGLPIPAIHNALYVHLVYLLQQGETARFLGTLEALAPEAERKSAYGIFSLSLLLAAGYALTGMRPKAAALLERAAKVGFPDGLMLHFAGYSRLFPGLVEELIAEKYPQLLESFHAIQAQFETGWQTLHTAVAKNELPADLTAREREIARLAAEGLRNSEIAVRLFIAESTVRTHLRAIFQKLDIDRRAKLAERLR